jgi:hypothetical protein
MGNKIQIKNMFFQKTTFYWFFDFFWQAKPDQFWILQFFFEKNCSSKMGSTNFTETEIWIFEKIVSEISISISKFQIQKKSEFEFNI